MTRHKRVVAIALAVSALARGADEWTLTTADFKAQAVTPRSLGGGTLTVTADGVERQIAAAGVVGLARVSRAKRSAGLMLCVEDGQRLLGTPKQIEGTNLIWTVIGFGDVAVPVESAFAVSRDGATPIDSVAALTEDVARLLSGDAVRGILTDASPEGFAFTPSGGGDAVKVPAASVASIEFATPPGTRKPAPAPAYLVRTNGGGVIAADDVTLSGNRLVIHTNAGERAIALGEVESIDHTGGPVSWLSARRPTESVHTPFLDGNLPARLDATVLGAPIRFGGLTYAHGIGVHSRSKIVFDVRPGDKTFRTRYAIDGSLGRADVDVRVRIDDAIVHEQKGFRAGVLSPVITADLSGAKSITLEVDYGQGYDVQDRLNWIEPAVIVSK